ncbi:hypothetical protein [Desertivirga brevis]|uniref:hypothetical protein n=1 Tax=Desertivirga brevis TaxID=2810310 RepID=UPI001A97B209|nr:hypothetical protein [Pedobacter sp. SYSU D00873]
MNKRWIIIYSLLILLGHQSCNNSNRAEASKEAPSERADSVEQDQVEVKDGTPD